MSPRLENLTLKEKFLLAVLGAAILTGLAGGGAEVLRSHVRSITPHPALYRELRKALPDPERIGVRASRPAGEGVDYGPDGGQVFLTRPLLPGEREIEVTEDGWIFFPRDYYTTININEAGVEELATLPGIGPALARRILEYRKKYVGFARLKSLKKVKGIGEKTLKRLEGRVRLY